MLKLRTQLARPAARANVVDISGPLPEAASKANHARSTEPLPYLEGPVVSAALGRTAWRRDATAMSDLPPELDPFESDLPWTGWTEARHEAFVASTLRTPTFERDLRRVLAMFAN